MRSAQPVVAVTKSIASTWNGPCDHDAVGTLDAQVWPPLCVTYSFSPATTYQLLVDPKLALSVPSVLPCSGPLLGRLTPPNAHLRRWSSRRRRGPARSHGPRPPPRAGRCWRRRTVAHRRGALPRSAAGRKSDLAPVRASIYRVEQRSPGEFVHREPPVTSRRESEGDRPRTGRHPKGFGHGPGEPTVACLVGPGRRVYPPVSSRPMAKPTRSFRKLTAVPH